VCCVVLLDNVGQGGNAHILIWGGLWSLVECENDEKTINQVITKFDKNAVIKNKLPTVKHSFTHYHLMINPIVVTCSKTLWRGGE
jgi:A/G-specific adenine glycosylase